MGGVDRLHGLTSHAEGHAALVVGIHGDIVGDSLGQTVYGGLGFTDDLPMGVEVVRINAPADEVALGSLHGIPRDGHVAGILAPLCGEIGGIGGGFAAAVAEDAETADGEFASRGDLAEVDEHEMADGGHLLQLGIVMGEILGAVTAVDEGEPVLAVHRCAKCYLVHKIAPFPPVSGTTLDALVQITSRFKIMKRYRDLVKIPK